MQSLCSTALRLCGWGPRAPAGSAPVWAASSRTLLQSCPPLLDLSRNWTTMPSGGGPKNSVFQLCLRAATTCSTRTRPSRPVCLQSQGTRLSEKSQPQELHPGQLTRKMWLPPATSKSVTSRRGRPGPRRQSSIAACCGSPRVRAATAMELAADPHGRVKTRHMRRHSPAASAPPRSRRAAARRPARRASARTPAGRRGAAASPPGNRPASSQPPRHLSATGTGSART
mmetsp:Transcript_45514/g.146073  ORF Transcript_45514/g.146073 Transcript_45514/m.146073 type:complete len:228 (-) Transcript_45514:242-925(-)